MRPGPCGLSPHSGHRPDGPLRAEASSFSRRLATLPLLMPHLLSARLPSILPPAPHGGLPAPPGSAAAFQLAKCGVDATQRVLSVGASPHRPSRSPATTRFPRRDLSGESAFESACLARLPRPPPAPLGFRDSGSASLRLVCRLSTRPPTANAFLPLNVRTIATKL